MSATASVTEATRRRRRPRTFPIVETFGPTIQGEGPAAGRVCAFIRLGGCDYRCAWCDSMHAVDPAQVRQAERLTAEAVVDRVPSAPLTILSGGNPALHELGDVVHGLQQHGSAVHVETQGSVWRPWLGAVDKLIVSPKPPSSGMATAAHLAGFERFIAAARRAHAAADLALKIVVFDEHDYCWALNLSERYAPSLPLYLSVGTPTPATSTLDLSDADVQRIVGERYRWLCERVAGDERAHGATVLPQLHVIAWGTRQGV